MFARCFTLAVTLLIAASTVACGDSGSGVDGDKTLRTLTADDRTALCEWIVDTNGGPGHVTQCSPTRTRVTGTVSECVSELPRSCSATVDQVEACAEATSGDDCPRQNETPECDPLRNC